jgi:hypothetical protein
VAKPGPALLAESGLREAPRAALPLELRPNVRHTIADDCGAGGLDGEPQNLTAKTACGAGEEAFGRAMRQTPPQLHEPIQIRSSAAGAGEARD